VRRDDARHSLSQHTRTNELQYYYHYYEDDDDERDEREHDGYDAPTRSHG
jgi:hypothetical protein